MERAATLPASSALPSIPALQSAQSNTLLFEGSSDTSRFNQYSASASSSPIAQAPVWSGSNRMLRGGSPPGTSPSGVHFLGGGDEESLGSPAAQLLKKLSHNQDASDLPAPGSISKLSRAQSCGVSSSHQQQQQQSPHSTSSGSPQHTSGNNNNNNAGIDGLPQNILITPATDAMQAAGLINLALSQPKTPSFLLQVQPPQAQQGGPAAGRQQGGINSKAGRSLLSIAVSVVMAARKINTATQQNTELAMLPSFSPGPPGISRNNQGTTECMDVHVYRLQIPPQLMLMHAQSMRVDLSISPLMLSIQLAQGISNGAIVDVAFGANTAGAAVQAMALARSNLTASGHDLVLLPQQIDPTGSGSSHPNALCYLTKAIPTSLLLQSREASSSGRGKTPPLPTPSALDFAALGMHGSSMRASPTPPSDPSASLISNAALVDRLAAGYYPPQNQFGWGAGAAGGAGLFGGAGMMPDASAFPTPHASHHSSVMALLGNSGGGFPSLAAANSASARPRARKADWVIVTEDTAIKNAAGAVAKVLGRVADQGLCCPVFTEKKTERYTAVVSVAVKAITVARGYVANEGTGHELGFLPYLRGGEGGGFHGHGYSQGGGPGEDERSDEMQQYLIEQGGPQHRYKGSGGGAREGQHNRMMGMQHGMREDEEEGGHSGYSERAEMAFDVYKLPQIPEVPEMGNLPVKVTAHSRPNVVSNIITKLVSEREGAVLITAGGKAMHVAMTAVVSARARLRSRCCDILLLPKFVTVDTTSTLGWESVFLRFTIVRWPAMPQGGLASTAAGMMGMMGGGMGSMMAGGNMNMGMGSMMGGAANMMQGGFGSGGMGAGMGGMMGSNMGAMAGGLNLGFEPGFDTGYPPPYQHQQ